MNLNIMLAVIWLFSADVNACFITLGLHYQHS